MALWNLSNSKSCKNGFCYKRKTRHYNRRRCTHRFWTQSKGCEAIFSIKEKLHEPLQLAKDYGVKILLEPHGKYTDSVPHMERIIDACDSEALGVNLDTGNLWLGGGDSIEMIQKLGDKIEHVHWKDLPEEYEAQRGDIYGCGMALIPLGSGVINIEEIYRELVKIGFDGYTTLEVAGEDAVKKSATYLKQLEAKYT